MRTLITSCVLLGRRIPVGSRNGDLHTHTYTHNPYKSLCWLACPVELSLHFWSLLNLDKCWTTSGSPFTCVDQVSRPLSPLLPLPPTQDLAFGQSPEGAVLANPPFSATHPDAGIRGRGGQPLGGGWEGCPGSHACPPFHLFLFRQIPSLHSGNSY